MVSPEIAFLEATARLSHLADIIPGFEFDRRRVLVERDPDRIVAFAQGIQLVAQDPPDHQDAPVALAEMLLGMQRDRALADLGLVISRELLVFLLGHVPPELAIEFRAHPADVARLLYAAGDIDPE